MKETIEEIIKNIHVELKKQPNDSFTLVSGGSGRALFNLLYAKQFKDNIVSEKLQDDLQEIGESSFVCPDLTLCNGRSGINWFFTYLYKEDYLDLEVKEIICSNNDYLALKAEEYLSHGFYDFLHGALGIAYYLLYNPSFTDITFFEKMFTGLDRIKEMSGETIPDWDIENRKFNLNSINLGLAHGLPSVLKFCIQCYKQNICKKQAAEFADGIVQYLIKIKNKDVSTCYYPSVYKKGENLYPPSRLAWCYGDLSLAFILYQYGECFDKKDVKDFALKILKDTTFRRSIEKTRVKDAAICHGSAGIAHIYNKLWHYTGEEIFREACEFWVNDIISLWEKGDGSIYGKYNGNSDSYETSTSLLEGSTGVGLVLLSYLSAEFSWDYCLMLND